MSDPAKTPEEIEDVLASVRRLVSDHVPSGEGATARDAAVSAPDPTPSRPDALILTPSFRVTDPEDPWVPVGASDDGNVDETGSVDMGPDTLSPHVLAAEDLIAEIVSTEPAAPDQRDGTAAETAKVGTNWQPDDRLASYDAVGPVEEAEETSVDWTDGPDADVESVEDEDAEAQGTEEVDPEQADAEDDDVESHDAHGMEDVASEEDIADLARLDGPGYPVTDFESETGDDNWPEGGAEAALLTLVARRDPAPDVSDDAVDQAADVIDIDTHSDDGDDIETGVSFADGTDTDADAQDDTVLDDVALALSGIVGAVSSVEGAPQEDAPSSESNAAHDAEIDHELDAELTDAEQEDATQGDTAEEDAPEHVEPEHVAEDGPAAADHGTPDQTVLGDGADPDDADLLSELGDDLSNVTPVFSRSKTRSEDVSLAPVVDLDDTTSPFASSDTDAGILDEDTLREIIVEVVREELQGVMGQRITRNVRKMVRREIRLALAVDDLE